MRCERFLLSEFALWRVLEKINIIEFNILVIDFKLNFYWKINAHNICVLLFE